MGMAAYLTGTSGRLNHGLGGYAKMGGLALGVAAIYLMMQEHTEE
jgi:hypothetical protein